MKRKFSSKKNKSVSIFNHNINNIGKINIKSAIKPLSIPKKVNFKKEDILYYDKSQKETLLTLIKNSQLNILMQLSSENSSEKVNKEKVNIIKDFLKDLKNFLAHLLNEKIGNKDYLQINVNKKKQRLQSEIADNLKYDRGRKINIKSNSIIKRKKSFPKNIETEMVEKIFVGSELSKLKLQNFQTENEVLKTEFSIFNLRRTLQYINNTIIFPEDGREIYCYNKKNQDKIDNVINHMKQKESDKLNNMKEMLKKIKTEQDQNINAINKIKNEITMRHNILEKDIIYELSIENRITSNS